jgi:CDP-diacylglycerol--glycerol-3-phosphate 3-phosphatidyltransferase
MITAQIGRAFQYLHSGAVRGLALTRLNPNILTFVGFSINLSAAYLFAEGSFFAAGCTVFLAGVFDLTDGPVARVTNRATSFGAFFDSVMDRYSDMILYIGLLIYYARAGSTLYVVLVAVVMIGAVMTSYTRARAESFLPSCKVGFLERPERVVLILIGSLFDRMAAVLWVTAFFSNVTVIHRCFYTWQESRKLPLISPR